MSNVELGTEGYTHLVPIEGQPGLYTYKDLVLDEGRFKEVEAMILEANLPKPNLGELKLVPLEGYPGFYTFRPVDVT